MEYTPEQLENVQKLASIFMKITDIALIIEVPPEQLRADIQADCTEVARRYKRGKALSKMELLQQEMSLAKVGSPLALENASKNLLNMEDDE
jgi:hypothetical protein